MSTKDGNLKKEVSQNKYLYELKKYQTLLNYIGNTYMHLYYTLYNWYIILLYIYI